VLCCAVMRVCGYPPPPPPSSRVFSLTAPTLSVQQE
jgi:hypothetical protein